MNTIPTWLNDLAEEYNASIRVLDGEFYELTYIGRHELNILGNKDDDTIEFAIVNSATGESVTIVSATNPLDALEKADYLDGYHEAIPLDGFPF